MNFIKYLKTKIKHIVGVAALAALLSQLITPALTASAGTPRFNFLPGDLELLRGANTTQNESVWKDPVTGTAGDEFRGLVYYHNGMLDTTAENTKIKVMIPSTTTNKTAKITASISADNAETVTNTVVDGEIVGRDGLTANFDQDVNLEFVPGSVKWFPNSNVNGGPDQTPATLPSGQSGNEIIGSHGLNIGSINGCWEFAGFVTFGFRAKEKVAPSLTLTKNVRNESRGETSFADHTNGKTGDNVEFKIDVTNGGADALSDAILKDNLPSGLTFENGSLSGSINGTTSKAFSEAEAASFLGGGLNIGTLNPGVTAKSTFKFQAKVASTSKDSLVNTATVTAEGLTSSDTASVNIEREEIQKSKSAFNNSRGQVATVAGAGDEITYTLNTKNAGNVAADYVVSDNISDILEYADVTAVSNGGQVADGVVSYPSLTINPGQTMARTFKVKVKNPLPTNPQNGYHFDYVMFNNYGNDVVICIEKPVLNPNLSIAKFVRDITSGEANPVKSDTALAGDTLEYRINFSNTGAGPADQVRISDLLPANVSYIAGTTSISRNGGTLQTLPDGITGDGITLDTIASGESDFIVFRAVIAGSIAGGERLVNTAFLADNGKTISDTAETVIVVKIVPIATPLPKTGATGAASFLFTFMAGVGGVYAKYRKLMNGSEAQVVLDLLNR